MRSSVPHPKMGWGTQLITPFWVALPAALAALMAVSSGCAERAARFPQGPSDLVWPPSPDVPRIRYVGWLDGERSLGRTKNGLQILGEVFTGPRSAIEFASPNAVAVRGDEVAVADPAAPGGPTVYRMNLRTRTMTTIREVNGTSLEWPLDLFYMDGALGIVDAQAGNIWLLDAGGTARRLAVSHAFDRPVSAAWSADAQRLWVADSAAHRCLGLDRTGAVATTLGEDALRFPTAVATGRDGRVAICDTMNFRVALMARDSADLRFIGKKGNGAGDFSLPRDAAFDSEGHLYVLDNQFENIQMFDERGRLLMAFGQGGSDPGMFNLPSGITIDDQDRIWVADTRNRRVQVFQYLREKPEWNDPVQ